MSECQPFRYDHTSPTVSTLHTSDFRELQSSEFRNNLMEPETSTCQLPLVFSPSAPSPSPSPAIGITTIINENTGWKLESGSSLHIFSTDQLGLRAEASALCHLGIWSVVHGVMGMEIRMGSADCRLLRVCVCVATWELGCWNLGVER